ncbi:MULTISPECIES: NAD(P)-dependent oxidoreductase [Micrococcales]|jgi:3-hydroxyisobutyrate dehydrogenase-like beta-hydroxyacid dehydrogenase|uniref:Putative oxidoreductase n=1 Tax=Arthrobacter sp. BP2 TaxID=209589 RepID=Q84H84_9MICC|nr:MULTISPECIES: NAD(P)-dependent oxidoreductase [Micrococcales]AAN37483.1 putative oxidoreductase [Arthrobacter sp. BP2]MCR1161075.1 NAD(P)-dependent oxidoreductase [Paenarthrobacter sp. UW852]MDZ5078513.1 NAD(P)-dependent oxidoreductase [Nesterenkonia sp. HG001]MEA1262003.1 NAD(P)-dependent oxidoreductase [Microbacterium sp. STF-2]UKA69621.1 NAD(P)-dependent oxidoreductase [Arthrobacter sp. FW306-06-A]
MSKKIGFVGLGTMGLPMAVNLNRAGFEVIGYDAFEGSRQKAIAAGITMAETLKDVAEQADDAIVSMVRDYAQNVDVILGQDGLLSANPKNLTIIVMSTLDPDTMNELGQQVEEHGEVRLIAAAVSGGSTGAEAGTLSIMASGAEDVVTAASPYFDAVGSNTFYYGSKPGNSQAAKLVNNLVLGINMNAVAEGLKFGAQYNLPEAELLNLFKVSTGDSWVARNWDAVSEWTADTALAVLLKDLKAAHLKGLEHHVAMPFNALSSTQLFDSMGQNNLQTK